MNPVLRSDRTEMGGGDLARVLSPLTFFLAHVLYLALWSPDPFLTRWLEGSFSFFLALVACNIVRTRILARRHGDGLAASPDDGTRDDHAGPSPPGDAAP